MEESADRVWRKHAYVLVMSTGVQWLQLLLTLFVLAGIPLLRNRLSRGVPVEQWWQKSRKRLADKDIDPLLTEMYQSSMKMSENFTREFKDFWAMPDDFKM